MNATDLATLGLSNVGTVYRNLSTPRLYEEAIRRHEGRLAHLGPLLVRTGQYTGRSPNDRFIVDEPSSRAEIWWGRVNRPISVDNFERIRRRMLAYLQGRDLFVQECAVGADARYRLPVTVVTESAWHALFAHTMFLRTAETTSSSQRPLTLLHAPGFHADPETDGTRSEAFILLALAARTILIGGTAYAGEMKKAVFTAMNFFLPHSDVLPMHCAANEAEDGTVALFLGLSGTGKTTLSTDPTRLLIGDDEIGWSEDGVFNFEGGCYAKVIRLSREHEPAIYETTRRFGTILENVGFAADTGRIDLDDASITENTRAAYPIDAIDAIKPGSMGASPRNVVFLTADAFGVLPPISELTPAQAMYHFLSGYTAKVAGTERGVTEPKATFSPCFGAPFMPMSPTVYAKMLGDRIARFGAKVWLLNTGWTGGAYGVGARIPLPVTRAMLKAALAGTLANVPRRTDPTFGLAVPTECPGVDSRLLDARETFSDPREYDVQAQRLAKMFVENFKAFERDVAPEVKAAAQIGRARL